MGTIKMNDNLKALIRTTGVSPRHLNARLDDFDFKVNLETENGAFITGPVGTGKTHLISAIAKEYVFRYAKHSDGSNDNFNPDAIGSEPKLPIFITLPEFLFELKQSYDNKTTDTEDYLLKKYSSCDVLLLDDLGAEKSSEWSIQILFLLIDRRYSQMKKTFISSNLSLKEISEQLDDRIASRINQMCDVLKLTGKDKRVQ